MELRFLALAHRYVASISLNGSIHLALEWFVGHNIFYTILNRIQLWVFWAFGINLLSGEGYRICLRICQYWLRWWIGAVKYQAISWTNVCEVQWRHIVSSLYGNIRSAARFCEISSAVWVISWGQKGVGMLMISRENWTKYVEDFD